MKITDEMVTTAVLALAHHNVAPDIQGMLVNGNDKNRIKPGALRAAITAALSQCEQEPVGWRLMPIEPTREMWAAMADTLYGYKNRHHDKVAGDLYYAAIASAPPAPADVRAQTIRECAEIASKFEDWGDYSGDLETASSQIKDRILQLLKEP